MSYFTETFEMICENKSTDYIRSGVPLHKSLNKKKINNLEKVKRFAGSKIREINKKLNTGANVTITIDEPNDSLWPDYNKNSNVLDFGYFARINSKDGREISKKIANEFNNDEKCIKGVDGFRCKLIASYISKGGDKDEPNGTGLIGLRVNFD